MRSVLPTRTCAALPPLPHQRERAGVRALILTLATAAATALPPSFTQAQTLPAPQAQQTRTVSFTYDETTGLLKDETVELGSPDQCVQTTHEYDDYGNRRLVTTSTCPGASAAAAFSSRSAASDHQDPTQLTPNVLSGSYPLVTSNALGHAERKKYSAAFGQPEELLGPNGLKTTWTHDEFGRKVRETRADGSYTEVAYCYATADHNGAANTPRRTRCDALIALVPQAARPGHATFTHTQAYFSSGAVAGPWSRTYHDRLGREVRSLTQAFDGGDASTAGWFIAADTRYNTNGAQVLSTQPYFIDAAGAARGSLPGSAAGAAYGISFIHYDVLGRSVFTMASEGGQVAVPGSRTVAELQSLATTLGNSAEGKAIAGAMEAFTALGLPAHMTGQRYSFSTTAYDGAQVTTSRWQPAITADSQAERRLAERAWRNPQGKVMLTQDAAGAQTGYGYDAQDNLVTTLDPLGNRTDVRYDARGRRTHLSDPNKGLWTYEYNALGELAAQQSPNQRAKGLKTSFAYDTLGRLVRRQGDEYRTDYLYDTRTGQSGVADQAAGAPCLNTAATTGNSSATTTVGRLCGTRTSHGVSRATTYDTKLRALSETSSIAIAGAGAKTFTQATTYDANGRPYLSSYPSGLVVQTRFSALGFVTSVGNTAGTHLYYQPQRANAWGKVEDGRLGHGVYSRNRYDPLSGRSLLSGAGTGTSAADTSKEALNVMRHSTVWDSLGNLQMHGDDHGDGQGVATSDKYLYDELNRLVQYDVNGRNVSNRVVQLKYNALGNILVRTDVGAYVYPAAGQPQPHAVQFIRGAAYNTGYSADFRYDAHGNLTSATGNPKYRTLRYNSFNLPQGDGSLPALEGTPDAQGRRSTYDWAYDEDEQRIRETKVSVRGTRVTWYLHPDGAGGLGYEQEQDEAGQVNHRHFIGAGSATAMVLMQGATPTAIAKTEYWHKDHLGSTVALTVASSDGTALARIVRYAYDPFGKRRYESGAYDATGALIADYSGGSPVADAGTDRGFTGHEHLDDVGIIHMNGRTYDPLIARFMQADPVVGDPFDLQSYNGYSYVRNRPLNTFDPDGRCEVLCISVISIVFARATGIIDQQTFRQLMGIAAAVALGPGGYMALAESAVANAAIAGFASGAISSGTLKGGVQGAFSAMVFYGVGQAANGLEMNGLMADGFANNTNAWSSGGLGRAGLHALGGCVTSVAGGGNCGRGALTAGVGKLITGNMGRAGRVDGTIRAAVVGGTLSVLGGGKFANGAQTGAFQYLFNDLVSRLKIAGGTISQQQAIRDAVKVINGAPSGKALDAAIPPGEIRVEVLSISPINASATTSAPFVTKISTEFVDGFVCCYLNATGGASSFTLERVLAHEFGHHTGLPDIGTPQSMGNVNTWENKIMKEIAPNQPDRAAYAPAVWPLQPVK
jgi:RHS repeat-associated protein